MFFSNYILEWCLPFLKESYKNKYFLQIFNEKSSKEILEFCQSKKKNVNLYVIREE